MEISDITVKLIDNRPYLKGTASIVIDNAIKIRKISLVQGKNDEIFVSWPAEKLKNGRFISIAYPISNDVRLEISKHILEEYNRAVADRTNSGE